MGTPRSPPPSAGPALPPSRPGGRHQIKRSLTELASVKHGPLTAATHHTSRHSIHHQHHHRHRHDERTHGRGPHHYLRAFEKEHQTKHPGLGGTRSMLDMSRPVQLGHVRGESVNVVTQVNGAEEARAKGEALRRETDKAELRADGLKRSIVELNTFSSTATRRLDETYFAVLEKTSALQNTIMALKDLAEGSKEIYGTFETEASELESDIRRQLDGLGSFEGQENKIKSLQSRIGEGRTKMKDLGARVDAVRERVESWERADQAWQDKTRRRLKVAWKVVFIFILTAVVLLVGLSYLHPEEHAGTTLDELRDALPPSLRQKAFNISRRVPVLSNCDAGTDAELSDVLRRTAPTDRGGLLRDFDEL